METDPLRALWNAMQTPNAPAFTFEEMQAGIGKEFRWLKSYYPAEFGDFLSLVAVIVLESTQNRDNPPLTITDFKKLLAKAAYQVRKSFDHVAGRLPDIPDEALSPEAIAESKDNTAELTAFLSEHFSPTELTLLEIILTESTQVAAKLLKISDKTLRQRRKRLLDRLHALQRLFPHE